MPNVFLSFSFLKIKIKTLKLNYSKLPSGILNTWNLSFSCPRAGADLWQGPVSTFNLPFATISATFPLELPKLRATKTASSLSENTKNHLVPSVLL